MVGDVYLIGTRDDYSPRIGILVSQLQNTRHYLLRASRSLTAAQLDAQPAAAPNCIGALLAHLDAAENMFQRITFEDRGFNEKETPRYSPYFEFQGGERSRGRDIDSYHRDLEETRVRTLASLRERDDAWLDTPKTFRRQPANIFYYWFHYLQDEARHTGQIILIRKHLIAGAEPDFDPYLP